MRRLNRPKGFTLIELLIVVAMITILLVIAAPAFTSFISNNRVTSAANDFLQGVTLTRNEALKAGKRVYLIPHESALPTALAKFTGSWRFGWSVCTRLDSATAATGCDADAVVFRHVALETSTAVADATGTAPQPFTDSSSKTYISFDGTGYPRTLGPGSATLTGGIWLNDTIASATPNKRTLCLAVLGTVRIVKGNVLCQ